MSRVRDRTEDFKDSIRVAALSHGYTESQLAALMSSFIIRKPSPRSPFTNAAIKTLESIRELEKFIVKHRKDYVDMHRTTEQERDTIEHEESRAWWLAVLPLSLDKLTIYLLLALVFLGFLCVFGKAYVFLPCVENI